MVLPTGLEPAHLSAMDPKSIVSANSTTGANISNSLSRTVRFVNKSAVAFLIQISLDFIQYLMYHYIEHSFATISSEMVGWTERYLLMLLCLNTETAKADL